MKHSILKKIGLIVLFLLAVIFYFSLPNPLFNKPLSFVIEDKYGVLLGAHIADDEQWRFPCNYNVPNKFKIAITNFEDKAFYFHSGVDYSAIVRAIYLNIKHKKILSGGSTISMQVVRLSRNNKSRTIFEKIIEIILTYRLELTYSKNEILALYASNAPFGGNVVGLEAASWRYFGRKPNKLSWAETAMLAVLPNSPSLINLGKNREKLFAKRNKLLKNLFDKKIFDKTTYELSIIEPIPENPQAFPQFAPHLLNKIRNKYQYSLNKTRTTIDVAIQEKINRILTSHVTKLSENGIHNTATIVVDIESGNIISYNGNISSKKEHGEDVNIIEAERSTGSVLKPFLYAAMLTSGEILPQSLVPDIPIQIKGYTPENYNQGYDGAIPANRAIARSLNIPAVKMLQSYGIERFIHLLKKLGMTSVNKSADYYGLSLILGGSEGKLIELVGMYASMARTLNHYSIFNSRYSKTDYFAPNYLSNPDKEKNTGLPVNLEKISTLSAASIWFTFNAMLDVERPQDESNWDLFSSSEKIAWKTGTSFGFRDGWAIGITPKYAVGVWVGNADGEGRPGLTGLNTAAPILFNIFDKLDDAPAWFEPPYDDMVQAPICKKSGYLASEICDDIDTMWIPKSGIQFSKCPYHKLIHLDIAEQFQVHDKCENTFNMKHVSWFVLPPAMEWYFKSKNPFYKQLPPFREDCLNAIENMGNNIMEVIYPKNFAKIYIPIELDGKKGRFVIELAHRLPHTKIFWHLDNEFIGFTIDFHQMPIITSEGYHAIKIVDEFGNELTQQFEIIEKE
ncbi:MAG TPA: penicillin-binding protein 1C [Bacteroidales bacterium]|nr:MAG: penicillin-binding protein 1C [Bacteroidetes bacterium GWF2_33_38]OFY68621.1 MAG: penicillin-binding protein 1C [Bacteroidetes bacterium RIFOXYA12_FULL_33_9]OFY85957.1 MAG: penicillin-binding protein 1C [Bacteroidetes bacterium RIFOXYA2_FULL_33_7]HBF88762.1 penicillin-binding protein 1C [Bacteroidales bacterium]